MMEGLRSRYAPDIALSAGSAVAEEEIKRLTALLSQAAQSQERMRREHAEAMAARDRDLRRAEARHAGQAKRMLAEVDRARQVAKALEAELAKEQQRRVRGEEAAAKRLEAELEKVKSCAGSRPRDRGGAARAACGSHSGCRLLLNESLASRRKSSTNVRPSQSKMPRGAK
ncbi:hypothetical protein J7E70_27540 [Variovorax paradoxus]|nr:hypothetical protein [Variovorax paradoxus]MBT2304193.1 hypothetical protein [Variovorax paradoxus]